MLVLGRKVGDEVLIGDDVKVTVLSIEKGRVRLGIVAPKGLPVWRLELLLKVKGPISTTTDGVHHSDSAPVG